MEIIGRGQLRHRFHGNYTAHIILLFPTEPQALRVLPLLGPGWTPAGKTDSLRRALSWTGDSEKLEACKKILGRLGADEAKIDSVKKSVDFGEEFEVKVTYKF